MTPAPESARVIDLRVAGAVWVFTWLSGQLLAGMVLALGPESAPGERSIALLSLGLLSSWAAYLAGLRWASVKAGTGDLRRDYQWAWAWADLWAIPAGVATQLVVVPGVYVPLRVIWPEVFSEDRLADNARALLDAAGGVWFVVLLLLVVVGAPVVEELVYRGLLQRSLAARLSGPVALLVGSAWFALIHFRPIEYPGLFVAGLLFGAAVLVTGRLGTAIAAHAAFNLAGLASVGLG